MRPIRWLLLPVLLIATLMLTGRVVPAASSAGDVLAGGGGAPSLAAPALGTIATFAGGQLPDGAPATSGPLYWTDDVAIDGTDRVYVSAVCQVRSVSGGIITTAAGNGTCFYSGDGGSAASAGTDSASIAVDGSGNLYIADGWNCRIREVSGGIVTTIAGNGNCRYSGDGGPATMASLSRTSIGVAADGHGNVFIADWGDCRIREISGGTINTVAGNGNCAFYGDGGPATAAALNSPIRMAVDADGSLYIAEYCRVRKVAGGIITTVAGNGSVQPGPWSIAPCVSSGDGGPATAAGLDTGGVAVDRSGNLYIADEANCRLRKVTGGIITTVAGNGICGTAGDGGPATSASLRDIRGIAFDSAGSVYFSDSCRIRKITAGTIATVAGTADCGYGGDGGHAANAYLFHPSGVAADSQGNVFIADDENCRVRKVSGGVITTIAGNGTCAHAGDGGPATAASLVTTPGVAVDASGNVYVVQNNDCRIRKVSAGIITTVAGNGTCGYSGDGGAADAAELAYPADVATDDAGNLYIADSGNCRIRKVAAGTITTVAGSSAQYAPCGYAFSGDGGPATAAQLYFPSAVEFYGGDMYIADAGNCRIRKVSGGIISTAFGNGTCGSSGDGGPASSASLEPGGLTFDSAGSLYIAGARSVRKITGGIISTVAGTGAYGFSGDGGAATDATFSSTTDVAAGSDGNLYIADIYNNRIRVVYGVALGGGGTGTPAAATSTAAAATSTPAAATSTSTPSISAAAVTPVSVGGIAWMPDPPPPSASGDARRDPTRGVPWAAAGVVALVAFSWLLRRRYRRR